MRAVVKEVIPDLNGVFIQFYEKFNLKVGDIVEIKDEKKSLTQLGYYRALVRDLAKKLHNSEGCQHNLMLRQVHIYKKFGDRIVYAVISADDTEVLEDTENHLEPTREVKIGKDGREWTAYRVLKGTREYTKAEMSRLIEATVDEARRNDVPTMSDAEWKRLSLGI